VHDRVTEQQLIEQVDQRHDEAAAEPDHPDRHRGTAERNAEPIELRFLAVKRDAVDELRSANVREQ
jgi:hypothetical protein